MDSIVVSMDKFGRILLPRKLRKQSGAQSFTVEANDSEIRLKPIPRLDEMFGSMPNLNLSKLRIQHEGDSNE